MGKFFARNPNNFVAPTASIMDAITQMRDPPRSFYRRNSAALGPPRGNIADLAPLLSSGIQRR